MDEKENDADCDLPPPFRRSLPVDFIPILVVLGLILAACGFGLGAVIRSMTFPDV